jgi:hypothetical protein
MKARIVVIPTAIIKGSWKVMILSGMLPKIITRKYWKESLEKLNSDGWKKIRMMRYLGQLQKNTRNQK